MGLLGNISSMFRGLTDFFSLFREIFSFFPLVVQVLIYFGFGGFILLCLLNMFHKGV